MSQDYTYVVARLNAMEATMPDSAWFLRLTRAPEHQLPNMIREHYRSFESVENLFEFESGLEADKAELIDLLTSVISNLHVREFLKAGYDFDNFTQALKGKLTGGRPVLLPFGMVDTEAVSAAVESGELGSMPAYLKNLSEKLMPHQEAGKINEIEYVSARMKYDYLLGAAPSAGAREWVRLKIDRMNIKNFMRFRMTDLRKNGIMQTWVGGGQIEPSRLAQLFKEPIEGFLSFLASTEWRAILSKGFQIGMDLDMIDTILDKQLMELSGENRYRFFDLLPVLYHLDIRERNEKLLRLIIVSRINRLPEEITSQRVEWIVS